MPYIIFANLFVSPSGITPIGIFLPKSCENVIIHSIKGLELQTPLMKQFCNFINLDQILMCTYFSGIQILV